MFRSCSAILLASTLIACSAAPVATQSSADDLLEARVLAALANAADLPRDGLSVDVNDGVVTLAGSVVCAECGGDATPGGSSTVQQSLGAVVRAIPGVERVEFDVQYTQ